MMKFEYWTDVQIAEDHISVEDRHNYLNSHGAQGWELVQIIVLNKTSRITFVWKRQLNV